MSVMIIRLENYLTAAREVAALTVSSDSAHPEQLKRSPLYWKIQSKNLPTFNTLARTITVSPRVQPTFPVSARISFS